MCNRIKHCKSCKACGDKENWRLAKKLDAKAEINEYTLVASGLVRRKLDGVRILAKGELKSKVNLVVTGASRAAIEAVSKAGGTLTTASSSE